MRNNMSKKKKTSPQEIIKRAHKSASMAIGDNFEAITADEAHTRTDDKRFIAWEKWVDPYGDNWEEHEWPGAFSPGGAEMEFDEDNIEEVGMPIDLGRNIRILNTPLGIIPLTEESKPSTVFNFWLAVTNFPITRKMVSILDDVEGVEILTIYTRYRFRISIGKLFKDREVMDRINRRMAAYLEHKESKKCQLNLTGELYRKKAN